MTLHIPETPLRARLRVVLILRSLHPNDLTRRAYPLGWRTLQGEQ